jgi:hypothetical protein
VKGKRRQKRRSEPPYTFGATRERMRQNGGVIVEQHAVSASNRAVMLRHRARYECRLDAYLARQKIDESQYRAGLQFRTAWLFKAHSIQTIDIIWSGDSTTLEKIDGGKKESKLEERLKRKNWSERILRDAYRKAGLTPHQRKIVIRVCGEDEFVGPAADIRTLQRALDKLARFWGF